MQNAALSTCHEQSGRALDKSRISPTMQLQAAFPQRLRQRFISEVGVEPEGQVSAGQRAKSKPGACFYFGLEPGSHDRQR